MAIAPGTEVYMHRPVYPLTSPEKEREQRRRRGMEMRRQMEANDGKIGIKKTKEVITTTFTIFQGDYLLGTVDRIVIDHGRDPKGKIKTTKIWRAVVRFGSLMMNQSTNFKTRKEAIGWLKKSNQFPTI